MLAGPAARALDSLSEEDVLFVKNLPKAELHAHLNGSIPLECLQQLAREHPKGLDGTDDPVIKHGLELLEKGVELEAIGDFFGLFPAIYALTSTPQTVRRATDAVLDAFLLPQNGKPECTFLELRTTPRETKHMTRLEYLEAVLNAMDRFGEDKCALIVSVDFRMLAEEAGQCVDAAVRLRTKGRRIVGLDLCGDFQVLHSSVFTHDLISIS